MTALVTGAGQGVGKGIALALAGAGCDVAINDKSDSHASEDTVSEIQSLGGDGSFIQADVSSSTEVARMFDQIFHRFRQLDILVNNAGVQTWKCLLELSEEEWDRVIDTNLKGCFLCTQAAAKHMKERKTGSIVNIGSGCNKLAFPNLISYAASKGGIEMFTKVAAAELGPYGIRVNCAAPGAIEVERTKHEHPHYAATWGAITPLQRIGLPSDVGAAVVFLGSEDSAFITGQTLFVDGGLFSQAPWPYDSQKQNTE